MLFKPRVKPTLSERIRVWLWPRRSFRRSLLYLYKQVLRLTGSPHFIALGFACGAYASVTPFVGFHFITAWVLAFFARGSMLAAASGTVVGNPLTFPIYWTSTYQLGTLLLEGRIVSDEINFHLLLSSEAASTFWPIFRNMLVGAIPLGLVVAVPSYFVIYTAARAYQKRRQTYLKEKINQVVTVSV